MKPLHAKWQPHEVPELQILLRRALNTWEPKFLPAWALPFADRVDAYVARLEAERAAQPKE